MDRINSDLKGIKIKEHFPRTRHGKTWPRDWHDRRNRGICSEIVKNRFVSGDVISSAYVQKPWGWAAGGVRRNIQC